MCEVVVFGVLVIALADLQFFIFVVIESWRDRIRIVEGIAVNITFKVNLF